MNALASSNKAISTSGAVMVIGGGVAGVGIVTSFAAGKEGEEFLNDVIAWYTVTLLNKWTDGDFEMKNQGGNRPLPALLSSCVGES